MPLRLPEPRLPRLTAVALCLAAPAAAEGPDDLVARYGPALDACYRAAETADLMGCRGAVADPCMAREEKGETTVGMVACMLAEAQVWAVWLDTEYRASMDWAEAQDEAERAAFPEFANRATALRDAQRAWIAFRDAECGLAYALWGAGSMRLLAGADCRLEMTAARARDLRVLRGSEG